MNRTRCAVCFAIGAVVLAVIATGIGYVWSEHSRVTMASTVHYPLLAALRDLRVTAAVGEQADLVRKLDQLNVCWRAYAFDKGETPELFVARIASGDVAACKEAATASSGAPKDEAAQQ